ncbi:hypothetical protein EJ05DRAFT_539909 [Pseudovirgaria hyperparasitica]|uniref:SUN domain-containing protein n=1 Tax=Pseudovirgaria hyperparasitica TaxID=470096 RepID=A0A6A6W231_9PEZI|nr:uncharacterized protein EJ05DRAFT_539909 [Pseudovirgaria hyperparasitica]KAF2756106.1 hypothetical protein EJ05DRAFT_539909 [Pseudovirgaria hyperparasitica]
MRTNGAFAWILATSFLRLAGCSAVNEAHVTPVTTTEELHSSTASPTPVSSTVASPISSPTPPATAQYLQKPYTTSSLTLKSASLPFTPSTCPSRTVNYLTHTLPQQCHKTSRAPLPEPPEAQDDMYEGPWALTRLPDRSQVAYRIPQNPDAGHATQTAAQSKPAVATTHPTSIESIVDTDSPLDDTNFLSFEEWKRQNLAKAGQSPDNIGGGRQAPDGRKRPGISNALDSLGEDAEIDLDFGFGPPETRDLERWRSTQPSTQGKERPSEGAEVPMSVGRSKDAGKTCKERFNYASFDCAANVLKTNSQSKSSSSVLVENKDSYMLNECRAENKFIIVELCDDILVDTVVLANYEFFSSMFRTFRVSVSDRFPVKMEGWKVLGIFEARNSRDIQAFLVEQPLIWARYLRVEFLTQYGNEYYCPVSLLRVHGTTMMEEYKNEEDLSRGNFYEDPLEEAAQEGVISGVPPMETPQEPSSEVVHSSAVEIMSRLVEKDNSNPVNTMTVPSLTDTSALPMTGNVSGQPSPGPDSSSAGHMTSSIDQESGQNDQHPTSYSLVFVNGTLTSVCNEHTPDATVGSSKDDATVIVQPSNEATPSTTQISSAEKISDPSHVPSAPQTSSATPEEHSVSPSPPHDSNHATRQQQPQSQQQSHVGRPSPTVPPTPNPTTQESVFKSIQKRLQQLEANSTLSLQYIEEQSRILRDAFVKVEKRQLSKTESFLQTLNDTVMTELRGFRQQYDLLWQSTILELEGQREQHATEVFAISSRLSILADELVFQKRMAVVQSTLLLLCLGLVLFVRSGIAGGLEVPIYQQVSNLKDQWRPMSPPQGWSSKLRATMSEVHIRRSTPTSSNAPTDDEAEHDSDKMLSPQSSPESNTGEVAKEREQMPEVQVAPPTPESPPEVYRESQSGPSTPRGSRDKAVMWPADDTDEQAEIPFSPVSSDEDEDHAHELINGV